MGAQRKRRAEGRIERAKGQRQRQQGGTDHEPARGLRRVAGKDRETKDQHRHRLGRRRRKNAVRPVDIPPQLHRDLGLHEPWIDRSRNMDVTSYR